jgi:DNA-binding MarR family transcriptional regulator
MSDVERQLRILEVLEEDPETTQAGLAAQLGVAVGSVNWCIKRLVKKGYIKATRMKRNRLKYFVTPEGLALKARLTREYMEASLRVYRELRAAARDALDRIRDEGYVTVRIEGQGEAMEIFHLTCLEEGVSLQKDGVAPAPEVQADGTGFAIVWPNDMTTIAGGNQ